jgi:POT family proton-dependent oligopeptide transporter
MSGHAESAAATYVPTRHTLFGHPTGLYGLFFAEMWERFSYYGMRALLVFYMQKGFLGFGDKEAYRVYGAYTSLVYMTPFLGGLVADRLIGPRKAVVLGGLLMAAGHLLMTAEHEVPFFVALALLIVGNGFFKPNISTIVGSLYPPHSTQRDGGFTIFYMGINLGAAMAPLLCGFVGEKFGWHYGFGLATVGMLIGLAVFVAPTLLSRGLILAGAIGAAFGMVFFQEDWILLVINGFVAAALVAAGGVAFVALGREGLPDEAGAARPEQVGMKVAGIPVAWVVYTLAVLVAPAVAALVYVNRSVTLIPVAVISRLPKLLGHVAGEASTPAGALLLVIGIGAFGYLIVESIRAERTERERLWVALTLMFFSMLFWAFFEQAGTSINNFTDRNVDRVSAAQVVTAADVGQELRVEATQGLVGFERDGKMFTLDQLEALRKEAIEKQESPDDVVISWKVSAQNIGMVKAGTEVPASTFQSANPIFILVFGVVFSYMWRVLADRGLEPSTPVKFSMGLVQLGLGFFVLWFAATNADARGMAGTLPLVLAYLLHTTGELCLSPVGLSMITRLSPARLVSTTMGAWFLATAYSSLAAAIIAGLTGVEEHEGGVGGIPVPLETVGTYGQVFFWVGVMASVAAVVLLAISPVLKKWMHGEK